MDDFIYIIALIAWVVFAFYRKSQKKGETAKKTRQQPPSHEVPRQFPTLEDILLGREPAPEPEPIAGPADASMTDGMAPALGETSFEREYNLRGITSIEELDKTFSMKDRIAAEAPEELINTDKNIEEDWRTKVDLRKAVIYSEILNRPYV